jgi:hypothetical protein
LSLRALVRLFFAPRGNQNKTKQEDPRRLYNRQYNCTMTPMWLFSWQILVVVSLWSLSSQRQLVSGAFSTAVNTTTTNNNNNEESTYSSSEGVIIPIKIDPFALVLSHGNTHQQLSMLDADVILGILEDFMTSFFAHYFHPASDDTTNNTTNTNNGGGWEFKYTILGLVSLSSLEQQDQQQQQYPTTTTLDFTGGIAYFAAAATNGTSTGTPTSAEVEMLVNMAFSDENDLVPALQQSFPYITKATLLWKNDGTNPTQQPQEPYVTATQPPLAQPQNAIQQQPSQQQQTSGFPNSSLLIGLICAVTGIVAISTLLLVRHRQQQQQQHQGQPTKKNKKPSALVTAATLDSPNNNNNNNNNDISDNNISVDTGSDLEYNYNDDEDLDGYFKIRSLHKRDSLRGGGDMSIFVATTSPPTPYHTSNNKNNKVDETKATTIKVPPFNNNNTTTKAGAGMGTPSFDTTAELSNTSFIGDIHDTSYNNNHNNNHNEPDLYHDDEDTCPSDFGGDSILVQPNLVPVTPGHMDDSVDQHDHHHHHHHGDMVVAATPSNTTSSVMLVTPPSQVLSSRSSSGRSIPLRWSATAAAAAAATATSMSSLNNKSQQGLETISTTVSPPNSKRQVVLNRILSSTRTLSLSSWSMSYFSGTATEDDEHDDDDDPDDINNNNNNNNNMDEAKFATTTRRTCAPRISRTCWSDDDNNTKTDDDNFTLDKAWDPDDMSINSVEGGADVFAGIVDDDDEISLLKPTIVPSDR